jgi:hypothetical protein
MDLPRCKICGERHRLGRCEVKHEAKEARRQEAPQEPRPSIVSGPQGPGLPQVHQPAKPAAFDRTAYQRELMRRRRLAKIPQNPKKPL